MVLFVFVVMLLDLGREGLEQERRWCAAVAWWGPGLLGGLLLAEFGYAALMLPAGHLGVQAVSPQEVGFALYSRYGLAVELVSLVLLAGLVGAYHVGRRLRDHEGQDPEAPPAAAGEEQA